MRILGRALLIWAAAVASGQELVGYGFTRFLGPQRVNLNISARDVTFFDHGSLRLDDLCSDVESGSRLTERGDLEGRVVLALIENRETVGCSRESSLLWLDRLGLAALVVGRQGGKSGISHFIHDGAWGAETRDLPTVWLDSPGEDMRSSSAIRADPGANPWPAMFEGPLWVVPMRLVLPAFALHTLVLAGVGLASSLGRGGCSCCGAAIGSLLPPLVFGCTLATCGVVCGSNALGFPFADDWLPYQPQALLSSQLGGFGIVQTLALGLHFRRLAAGLRTFSNGDAGWRAGAAAGPQGGADAVRAHARLIACWAVFFVGLDVAVGGLMITYGPAQFLAVLTAGTQMLAQICFAFYFLNRHASIALRRLQRVSDLDLDVGRNGGGDGGVQRRSTVGRLVRWLAIAALCQLGYCCIAMIAATPHFVTPHGWLLFWFVGGVFRVGITNAQVRAIFRPSPPRGAWRSSVAWWRSSLTTISTAESKAEHGGGAASSGRLGSSGATSSALSSHSCASVWASSGARSVSADVSAISSLTDGSARNHSTARSTLPSPLLPNPGGSSASAGGDDSSTVSHAAPPSAASWTKLCAKGVACPACSSAAAGGAAPQLVTTSLQLLCERNRDYEAGFECTRCEGGESVCIEGNIDTELLRGVLLLHCPVCEYDMCRECALRDDG